MILVVALELRDLIQRTWKAHRESSARPAPYLRRLRRLAATR